MQRPRKSSSAEPRTFDLRSCRDMRDKLYREVNRIKSTTVRADLADHCFNAAVTAWHLAEWVWSDLKNDRNLRLRLAKEAGVQPSKFDCNAFKDFVESDAQCPDLRICRIITTSSKHRGFKLKDGDPEFETIVSAQPGHDHTLELDEDGLFKVQKGWTHKIDVGDGKRYPVSDLFDRVLGYWTQFIYGHEIEASKSSEEMD